MTNSILKAVSDSEIMKKNLRRENNLNLLKKRILDVQAFMAVTFLLVFFSFFVFFKIPALAWIMLGGALITQAFSMLFFNRIRKRDLFR